MPEFISPLELAQEEGSPGETVEQSDAHGDELGAIRDLVLRAHPDIVPELVTGETVADILASVEPARTAWVRLAETFAGRRTAPEKPVPAGGGAPIALDPDRLPPAEKIRRGLTTESQKG